MRVRHLAAPWAILVPVALLTGGCGLLGGASGDSPGGSEPDRSTTFTATADTFVSSGERDSAGGEKKEIIAGGSPEQRALMTFTVTGWNGPVGHAVLRLRTNGDNNGSDDGGTVRAVSDTSWPESTLTWDRAPAGDGPRFGSFGTVTSSTWYDVDVTASVTGNGTYGFTISSDSDDAVHYDSRETGDHAPQLVLHTAGPGGAGKRSGADARTEVLVGAGDVSTCDNDHAEKTADLLASVEGTIFTAGDTNQDNGEGWRYDECFTRSWGRFKKRIRPAPGNHDYMTEDAKGYYDYFGKAAGERGKGYYSYDLGTWHVVALNSNCEIVGCEEGSDQEKWLRADLAASSKPCTAAYWHHPLFTSAEGHEGSEPVRPLFRALYDAGAEIVVNGHNHVYERFTPQNPDGEPDREKGIRVFTSGTGGGGDYYSFLEPRPTSRVRNSGTYGVLKFTLEKDGYRWQFLPVEGKSFTDSGTGVCH